MNKPRQAPAASERQQEKSAAMRRRICEGAVSCLSERGYHGASIKQVVDAAGVSLGALQYHFPTKDDLVEATAEFLLSRSVKWFQRAKLNIDKDKDAFGAMIRRSWREQFTTDEYGALLEILVAARTNGALRKRISPKLDHWRRDIEIELRGLLPANDEDADTLEAILTIGRCMMTGLLVHDGLLGDDKRMRKVVDAWVGIATDSSGQA